MLIGVEDQERVEDVRRVLLEVMAGHPRAENEPAPLLLVKDLSASSVDVIMRFRVSGAKTASSPAIAMQMRGAAKEAISASGIDLPSAHLQLHIDGAKGLEASGPAAPERPVMAQREEH